MSKAIYIATSVNSSGIFTKNTTGTASGLSTTLAVASGGTGVTSSTGTGSVVLSASPTFTGTVSGITATMVGLGNLTNNAAVANLSGTNTGDQILPTTLPASDVYAWAKAATKPTYTASDVGLVNVNNTTDLLKPISTATQTALDFKSPLASPTFTGTPSVPTATAGTNTTQIASTAYVRSEVSALVASAPTALDTLNELATALGNDANFSTTVTTALGLKAPLASPTFTGTVTAPTFIGNLTGNATGLSTTLAVASGGTGLTSSGTSGNLLTSNGTSWVSSPAPITLPSVGASGNVLTSNGTSWLSTPTGSTYTRTSFTATSGQTSFTVNYTVSYVEVYLNGILLNGADYTATSGTAIVLALGAVTGDIVETIAYTITSIGVASSSAGETFNPFLLMGA